MKFLSNLKIFFFQLSKEVFFVSSVAFFLFLILEDLKKGFVSFHLDLKIFLWILIISGMIALLGDKESRLTE